MGISLKEVFAICYRGNQKWWLLGSYQLLTTLLILLIYSDISNISITLTSLFSDLNYTPDAYRLGLLIIAFILWSSNLVAVWGFLFEKKTIPRYFSEHAPQLITILVDTALLTVTNLLVFYLTSLVLSVVSPKSAVIANSYILFVLIASLIYQVRQHLACYLRYQTTTFVEYHKFSWFHMLGETIVVIASIALALMTFGFSELLMAPIRWWVVINGVDRRYERAVG